MISGSHVEVNIIGSLYFSTGQFGIEMFKSYFANVYTIILNTAPILFVILILLIIVNRLWISVGIASILVIVLSLINYFKLSFRDDPLLVEDLSLFFEMRNMTERYKIHISSSMLMWIAGMVVITFILWKIRKNIKINTKIKTRIILGIILMLSAVGWVKYFILNDAYYQKTENIALINRWGSTQQFISRGFIYPFLYSSKDAGMKKPDGYNKKEIENSLKNEADIDDLLKQIHDMDFSEYIHHLFKKYHLKEADIIRKSGLERTYAYKIIRGEKGKNAKDKIYRLALAMNLTQKETNHLLSLNNAGDLYPHNARDLILLNGLLKKQTVEEVNIELYNHDLEPLKD